jgi:hypothetical protein
VGGDVTAAQDRKALEAENERLREALSRIASTCSHALAVGTGAPHTISAIEDLANAALEAGPS